MITRRAYGFPQPGALIALAMLSLPDSARHCRGRSDVHRPTEVQETPKAPRPAQRAFAGRLWRICRIMLTTVVISIILPHSQELRRVAQPG